MGTAIALDRPPSAKAIRAAASQREIVASAMRLIRQQGFHRTSMAQIAAEAKLTKGALYWHFRSKEDLGRAVLDAVRGEFVERVWSEARGRESALDRIDVIVETHLRLMLTGGVHCGVVHTMASEIGELEPGFAETLRRFVGEWAGIVERMLEKGIDQGTVRADVDPRGAARAIIGAVSGAFTHGRLFANVDVEETIDEVRRFVRRSISAA